MSFTTISSQNTRKTPFLTTTLQITVLGTTHFFLHATRQHYTPRRRRTRVKLGFFRYMIPPNEPVTHSHNLPPPIHTTTILLLRSDPLSRVLHMNVVECANFERHGEFRLLAFRAGRRGLLGEHHSRWTVKSLTLTLTRCKTNTSYFVPNDHLNLATSAFSPSQPAPSLTYGTGHGVCGVDGGGASTRRGVDVNINGAQGRTLADDGAASQANEARRRWCEDSGRTCVRVARRPRGVARMACTVC